MTSVSNVNDNASWRPVVFADQQQQQTSLYCNAQGQFYNKDNNKIVKPYCDKSRNRVRLQWKSKPYTPHLLVMAAWGSPEPSPDHVIQHVDGNKSNNELTNLRWVSQGELTAAAMADLSSEQLSGFTAQMFLLEATGNPNTAFDFASARPGFGCENALVSPQGLVCDAVTHKLLFDPELKSGRRLVRVKTKDKPSASVKAVSGVISVPPRSDKRGAPGTKLVYIDDLVAKTFLEPEKLPISRSECKVVHLNGNPRDCRAENLRWTALLPIEKRMRLVVAGNHQPYTVINMSTPSYPIVEWYKSFDEMYHALFSPLASRMAQHINVFSDASVRQACDSGQCIDDVYWPKRTHGGLLRVDPTNPQLAAAFLSAEDARRIVGIEPRDLLDALEAGPESGWRRASGEYDDVMVLHRASPGRNERGETIAFFDAWVYHSKTALLSDLVVRIRSEDSVGLHTAEIEARCLNRQRFELRWEDGKPCDGWVQLWFWDDFVRENVFYHLQEPNQWDRFGFGRLQQHEELNRQKTEREAEERKLDAIALDKQKRYAQQQKETAKWAKKQEKKYAALAAKKESKQ